MTPDPRLAGPDSGCALCPRLAAFRDANRATYPSFHNAPVPAFAPPAGDPAPWLLIVGMAPGLKGANATGRPFTGDGAGDLLYPALLRHGLADGVFDRRPDDGLRLIGCRITNAVRCVPPQNKTVAAEETNCRPFLVDEIAALREIGLSHILALGVVAHKAVLTTLGVRKADYPFAHAALHRHEGGLTLANSYHCSRYNVNTGRLTEAMFDAVFAAVIRDAG